MRRQMVLRVAAFLAPLAVFGCGEQPSAPYQKAEISAGPEYTVIVNNVAPDSMSADFTVTSTGGVFSLGKHAIYFPANSICDPTSSYGVTEWDKPCDVARQPVHIHAQITVVDGKASIDFSPALRFVPSSGASRAVVIFMRSGIIDNVDLARQQIILWSPGPGQDAVDESVSDATLRTFYVPSTGLLFRRIKHFSGYQVHDTYSDQGSSGQ